MSDKKRARQFLPFDGLAGYGSLIREAGREKEKKRPLSEDRAAMLDSIGRCLCLEGKKIDFEDIWEIEGR